MDKMPEPRAQDDRISPRETELIRYRDNRTRLYIRLMSGEEITGAVRWYDDHAIRFVKEDRNEITVYLHAIAYYQQAPHSTRE